MRTEKSKGSIEIEFFSEFVTASNLPYDLSTVEKRSPPEPDIICAHQTDGLVAFELVEICDPNLAEFNANVTVGGAHYMRTADPTPKIIKKKLSRKYKTTYPIELLCYTAGRVVTPARIITLTILPQLQSLSHPFRRVWLLSRGEVCEVWSVG